MPMIDPANPASAPDPVAARPPARRPKAILFDLDDTLWPLAPVLERAEQALHDWLAEHAPAVPQRFSIAALRAGRIALHEQQPALRGDVGALRRAGLAAAFAEAGADASHIDAAMAHFVAARSAVTLYDDVLPGLARLAPDYLLGSISNGNADLVVAGLAPHFKVSLAAGRHGPAKPHPALFLAACAALGLAPAEVLYVGDDLQLDVVAAQAAGLRAVWMNRAGSDAHLAAGVVPDAICADFDALLRWLEQLAPE